MLNLIRLARRYLSGQLDAQEVAALSERLRRDQSARKAFAQVLMHEVNSREFDEKALWRRVQVPLAKERQENQA